MPIKIGKSKSSSGSELIHSNSCSEESNTQTKKNRGIRQFFNRSKCNSKIPTGRSSATDEPSNNNKISRVFNKTADNININRNESPPVNIQSITCHSVSPKLYTSSCTSSIEELSKVASNINSNCPVTSSTIPCSPIQDVILEEDYEEALLLNNRTEPLNSAEDETSAKESAFQPSAPGKKISQGIYNEPNDSAQGCNKEIIETCRRCQITPTNQFKEIRSRSGSDTDPILVHPDIGVGGRCSTNSSSVGSAATLSDSPAVVSSYSPHTPADSHTSPNITTVPKTITPSITALSISIHSTSQSSSSGPPTVYTNSPKGNTIICHHPSSPFAPPPASKPNSSSNPSTALPTVTNSSPSTSPMFYDNLESKYSEPTKTPSSMSSIISRRPGRFNKPMTGGESAHSSGKQSTDGNTSLSDIPPPLKHSERRSEYYSKQPVYEEAWDLKLKRMCFDMSESRPPQLGLDRPVDNVSAFTSALPIQCIVPCNRPQSAAGVRRRTDSPGSKYSSPPAVPPHRRSSVHIKMTHCNSFEDPKLFSEHNQTCQSANDCRTGNLPSDDSFRDKAGQKTHLKHNINPSFDDQGVTTDYDYAYNETWSLGVQLNMTLNLSNNQTEPANIHRKDSGGLVSGYMDKIDSVDSEESSSLSTSQEATTTKSKEPPPQSCADTTAKVNIDKEVANVDNDSLSNDSYEEPWDVRHGRVISELTSARLIDPACVLSAHDQSPSSRNPTTTVAPGPHTTHRSHRNNEKTPHNSSSHHSARQRSISGSRRASTTAVPSASSSSASLINKNIVLDDQPWYHEDCSRHQAEQLLAGAVEGSFLVRRSETSRKDYSLTIRHNNDYLHMKISRNSRGFILGQYSQPYVTIPHMLHHYSLTMVPVRGADAVILKNPIVR